MYTLLAVSVLTGQMLYKVGLSGETEPTGCVCIQNFTSFVMLGKSFSLAHS